MYYSVDMANQKTYYICDNCGVKAPKWQGRCAACGEWNTLIEQKVTTTVAGKKVANFGSIGEPQSLAEVEVTKTPRYQTGMSEFDLVLGGGIVPGSLVLLGGDPGIGKSTLALQLANYLTVGKTVVLYVSGEESMSQIKMRNERLHGTQKLQVLTETDLENVVVTIVHAKPSVVIIDSIQTLNSQNINGVAGGVSQLAYTTNLLMRVAKENHIAILIIGHVTKEGMLAGPKTIEHMVDAVLYLEGERFGNLRLLRSTKNRFGSVGEVGVFDMQEDGLKEVSNTAGMFLEERRIGLPGSCVTAVLEGNKVLLLEVQALTSTSNFGYPKRTTSGFDVNRLQLIIAILQKTLKVNLGNQDVYINIAGGFKIEERAADLPVALAILSSYFGESLPDNVVAFSEIGLLGEVRPVSQLDKRWKEASKLGFKNVMTAAHSNYKSKLKGLEIIQSLQQLNTYFKGLSKKSRQ